MPSFIKTSILSVFISLLLGLSTNIFPWWSFAVAVFIIHCFFKQGHFLSFLSGFMSIFILWFCIALVMDVRNNHILSQKIASLFYMNGSSIMLIIVTGLIGGILGGLAALTGSFITINK
ncbi:MAG: hypothetical protein QM528_06975 [Phycisphaerales bacterium]|nr:hypothetical protein [Phycisphaerales bacterium]